MLCRNDCSIAVPAVEVKEPAAAVDFLGIGGDRDRDREAHSLVGHGGVDTRAAADAGVGGGRGVFPRPEGAAEAVVGGVTGNTAGMVAEATTGAKGGAGGVRTTDA